MARKIDKRWQVRGDLVTRTPLHVGGHTGNVDVDLALAQNGRQDSYVPGTSLAGPLRMWCLNTFGQPETEQIWGYQKPPAQDAATGEHGHASFVVVADIPIDGKYIEEVRDGVGIDRTYGGAAQHLKYDRAILPRGTRLPFKIIWEVDANGESRTQEMMVSLLNALEDEKIRLGAGKSRGLGRVRLENIKVVEDTLNTHSGILEVLRGSAQPTDNWRKRASATAQQSAVLNIEIDWRPIEPVMVKAGYDGVIVDMLPLVSGDGCDQMRLVLPGSGTKGALRSQAERIMRTLLDWQAPYGKTEKENISERERNLRSLEVPLVQWLFGMRGIKDNNETEDDDQDKLRLGLSALTIDDCYAKEAIDVQRWNEIMVANVDGRTNQNGNLLKILNESSLGDWKPTPHVAIDRWLGGAAEGALYSILEPHQVVWEPIRVSLNMDRIREDDQVAALALLFLVLRDFADEWIPLGFATHRGMGSVHVNHIGFSTDGNHALLQPLHDWQWQGKDFDEVVPKLPQLTEKWLQWLESNG